MKDTNLYRAMMNQAEPPAHLQTSVLERVELMRREQETFPPQPTAAKQHRRMPTLVKVAACLVAVVLVVGGAVAAPLLMNSTPNEGTQPAPTLADAFGLALYADAAEPGQTVSIATDESGLTPWGAEGSWPVSVLTYRMNLSCVGDGISTITYAIDGKDVSFELTTLKDNGAGELMPNAYTNPQEITVDYANQQPEDLVQQIKVDLRSEEDRALNNRWMDLYAKQEQTDDPDELAVLEEEQREVTDKQNSIQSARYAELPEDPEERMDALINESLRAHLTAVEKLSKATFSVTATFTDGSTAIKRYRIAPVENFEEVFRDHDESSSGGPRYPDPLFTITELG